MPLPPQLQSLVQQKRFWTDFFQLTTEDGFAPYPDLDGCSLDLVLGDSGYGLSIRFYASLFDLKLDFVSPDSKEDVEIAHLGMHSFPSALRWAEVDLICSAIASQDPGLPHPGWLILFLVSFAPICVGDDVDAIASMVDAALQEVELYQIEVHKVLEDNDACDAGFRWRFDDVVQGWHIQQYRDSTSGKRLYTHRSTNSKEFPFDSWPLMLAAAEKIANHGEKRLSDTQLWSVQTNSTLPSRWLLRRKHDFYLKINLEDKDKPRLQQGGLFVATLLNSILSSLALGEAEYFSGNSILTEEGRSVQTDYQLQVRIFDDVAHGLRVIQDALLWLRASDMTELTDTYWTRSSKRALLQSRLDGKDDEHCVLLGTLEAFYRKDGKPLRNANSPDSFHKALESSPIAQGENCWCGWTYYTYSASDGGQLEFNMKESLSEYTLDVVTIHIEQLTREVVDALYDLMQDGGLVMFPMLVAARPRTVEAALEKLDFVKKSSQEPDLMQPPVRTIESSDELFKILKQGPWAWWSM